MDEELVLKTSRSVTRFGGSIPFASAKIKYPFAGIGSQGGLRNHCLKDV